MRVARSIRLALSAWILWVAGAAVASPLAVMEAGDFWGDPLSPTAVGALDEGA